MKKNITLIIAFIIIITTSCKNESGKNSKLQEIQSGIKNSKQLVLKIDSLTFPITRNIQYYQDELLNNFLIYNNAFNEEILIFNIDSAKLVKRVKVEKSGPNGVGKFSSFYFHNFDSIFITTYRNDYMIYLINSNAILLNKYTFDTKEFPRNSMIHFETYSPAIFVKNTLYLANSKYFSVLGRELLDYDSITKIPQAIMVDVKQNVAKPTQLKFPKLKFVGKDISAYMYYFFTYDGENFIYSFLSDNNLYYTSDFIVSKKTDVKSEYVINTSPIINNMNDHLELINWQKFFYNNNLYNAIVYDKYRNLYYRFVSIGIEQNEENNYNETARFPYQLSIIVLDKNFKKVKEVLMPENRYYYYMYFVAAEGLYLALNDSDSEDKITFDILDLTKETE